MLPCVFRLPGALSFFFIIVSPRAQRRPPHQEEKNRKKGGEHRGATKKFTRALAVRHQHPPSMQTPNPLKRPAPAAHTGQRPATRRRVQFIIDDEDTGDASPPARPAASATTRTPPTLATGAVQTRLLFRPAATGASTVVMPSASLSGPGAAMMITTTTVTTSPPSASKPMATTTKTTAARASSTAGSASPKASASQTAAAAEAPKPRPLLPPPTASARTAILDAHYTVSKAGIPDSKFDAHRRWLTVEPPPNQYRAAGARGRGARGRGATRGRRTGGAAALSTQHVDADTGTETVQLYREDQLTFTVPRHYGLARWGMPPPAGDLRTRGDATHVPFTGTLTPEQTEVCRRVLVQFGVDPAEAVARLCQRPAHQAMPVRASLAAALASKAAGAVVRPVPSLQTTTAKMAAAAASPGSRSTSAAIGHAADGRAATAAERARMTRTPGASVKCPCGFGKTVCAIYIMCMTGVKAIFTVAQEDHMDKTEEEIRRFAPTARIGRVHRDRLDVGEGYDIVLAMVQTLLARRYEPSVFDRFGLWVADEMHHMAAPAFSQVGSTLRCYYTLGLTATPRRKDGLTPALFWTFGPMVANVRRVWDGVVCRMVRYAKGDQEEILMRNGQPNVSLMITRLATDPVRNYYVARAVVDCMVNPRPLPARRKVIVLSDRREQLVLLRELILDAMMRHLTGEDVVVADAPLDRAASPTDAETTTTTTTTTATSADAAVSVARDLLAIDSESEVNRTLIVSLLPPAPSASTETAGLVGSQARPAPLPLPSGWAPRSATALVEPPSDPASLPGATRPASFAGETDGDSAPSHGEPLFSIGYFVGGMKREAREQGKRCDVILATYAEAGEGMDIPQLDTVVMVSPRSDVEQATGRALRTHPAKNEPLFIYFVDDFSLFRNQGWIVQRYCAGEGYHVRWETIN
ncbi:DEAD-like helicase domain containing protein [Pandoravirus dulcis]|uniref:DEAD-like helicase domain containing protein n=1 Tax=Pandoravirus dulcis TaxID=1349409 RepID=S4VSC9_9VIRU|nr:DEAD-like helicase domain containing protein [Pandoravirus dulcis]AGO82315.2 DEAD-like helicase domain containing protein [Pandoravirus dulcis]